MIGFLAQSDIVPTSSVINPLIVFDDFSGISMPAAEHNVLALGGTGSGKTSSVILPAADRLIAAGYPGLIIDIKGNLGPQIRAIAAAHGRADDVVEFGPCIEAEPVNLLADLNASELQRMFEEILFAKKITSHSEDWHAAGIEYAIDIHKLLSFMSETDAALKPSLSLIAHLMNNYTDARSLFMNFACYGYEPTNSEQHAFITTMQSKEFHPCLDPHSEKEGAQQIEWRSRRLRSQLRELAETQGIDDNFFSAGCSLGIEKRIYDEKKIVLLRFAPSSEHAGAMISRHILTQMYRAVFKRGLSLPEGSHTFIIADEWQQFLSLGGKDGDDLFVARSREFHNIFVGASQSMSAMHSRAESSAVLALLTNFRTKLIFNCDDPVTEQWLDNYDFSSRKMQKGRAVALLAHAEDCVCNLQAEHDRLLPIVSSARMQGFVIKEDVQKSGNVPTFAHCDSNATTFFSNFKKGIIKQSKPTIKFENLVYRDKWERYGTNLLFFSTLKDMQLLNNVPEKYIFEIVLASSVLKDFKYEPTITAIYMKGNVLKIDSTNRSFTAAMNYDLQRRTQHYCMKCGNRTARKVKGLCVECRGLKETMIETPL